MYKKRQSDWFKHIDFMIMDLIFMFISYFTGFMVRFGLGSFRMGFQGIYWRLCILLAFINIFVMLFSENYKDIVQRSYILEIKETVRFCFYVDFVFFFYLFIAGQTGLYSRTVLIISGLMQMALVYMGRCIRKHIIRKKLLANPYVEQMLILADSKYAGICVDELVKEKYHGYKIIGVVLKDLEVLENEEERTQSIGGIPVVSGYFQIYDYLLNNVVDSIFICTDMEEKEKTHMINRFVRAGITVHLNLFNVNIPVHNRTVEQIGEYTVLTTGMMLASVRQIFFKRAMDICGALLGLFFTGLLSLFLVPIIHFQSSGPAFFKQNRVGKNGRTFQIYKFRSMYMDAEERKKELMEHNEMNGLMFKMDNDPRITPIGRFIRKYSIDEFPQFINVLKGDMSLVGTRPPTVDEFEQYLIYHRGRLNAKPGITGLWQTSGRSDVRNFEDVVDMDVEYISHWSISGDISIIMKTILLIFTGSGAK